MKAIIPSALIYLAAWVITSGANCHAAIIFSNAPEAGRVFAYKLVVEFLRADTNAFKGSQLNDLTITNSLPMYSVGKKDILSGKLLSTAKLAGWDYLVMQETNLVAFIPLNINPTDGEIIKSGGIMMDGEGQTTKAFHGAQGLAQVQKQDYELRYLTEELSFRMLWLHGKAKDIIIPMEPTYGLMVPYQSYSEEQVIGVLKPYLQREETADHR